jgi:hypothetical protein
MENSLFNDLYGSKYLSAADLDGKTIRKRIGRYTVEELEDPKDETKKRRIILYFNDLAKPLVLNKTNAQKLAASHGQDPNAWIGVFCDIYAEMTSLGKEGVRLRPIKSAADGAAAKDMGGDAIPF